jgi:TolA-binding protein
MSPRLPQIRPSMLREHGSSERVARIWRRLEPALERGPSSFRPGLVWAPALLSLVFGAGVFVGAKWTGPANQPMLTAEPARVPEPAAAARTQAAQPSAPETQARQPHQAIERRNHGATAPVEEIFPEELHQPAPVAIASAQVPLTPEWEQLADDGDFEAANLALADAGGFEAVRATASAPQLMALVDVARASGSRDRAISALRRVVDAFPGAPEAPLAAWTLGNMLEQAGDEPGAREAFVLYRRLSPAGDFAEDALAREVGSAIAQGDLELATRLVAQYENEFPNGRHLEQFRAELEKRAAGVVDDADDDDKAPADPADAAEAAQPPAAP